MAGEPRTEGRSARRMAGEPEVELSPPVRLQAVVEPGGEETNRQPFYERHKAHPRPPSPPEVSCQHFGG